MYFWVVFLYPIRAPKYLLIQGYEYQVTGRMSAMQVQVLYFSSRAFNSSSVRVSVSGFFPDGIVKLC